MPVTLTITDDLAEHLRPYEAQLSEIIELGIREWQARSETGYNGVGGLLETLAAMPSAKEVLALRPAPPLQERIDALLEKSRSAGLSPDEQREWGLCQYVEHLVRLAKITALRRLQEAAP